MGSLAGNTGDHWKSLGITDLRMGKPWVHWAGSLGITGDHWGSLGITGNFEGGEAMGSLGGITGRDHWKL